MCFNIRGLIFGKANFNSGDGPLFIKLFIDHWSLIIESNLLKSSFVKCSLFLIILNAGLNNCSNLKI